MHSSMTARACTGSKELISGSAKNSVIFPIASLCCPKMVALVKSHHFYKGNKASRINVIGASLKTGAFDNVGFQAVR